MLRGDGRPSKGFTGRAGKRNGTAWGGGPGGSRRKPEETCQGVGEGSAGDSLPSWAHLADAVDAEVTAGLALVAGGAIDHSVPQLLSKVLIRGPAVQLAGVHWGPKQRSREGQPGQGRSHGGHREDRLHDTHQWRAGGARLSTGARREQQPRQTVPVSLGNLGPWISALPGLSVPVGNRTHRH